MSGERKRTGEAGSCEVVGVGRGQETQWRTHTHTHTHKLTQPKMTKKKQLRKAVARGGPPPPPAAAPPPPVPTRSPTSGVCASAPMEDAAPADTDGRLPLTAEITAQFRKELAADGIPLLDSLGIGVDEEVITITNPETELRDVHGFKFVTWMAITDHDDVKTGGKIKVKYPSGLRSEMAQILQSYHFPRAHDAACDAMADLPTLSDMMNGVQRQPVAAL